MTLREAPNWNALWAGLMVEELTRAGVELFCIAPGSRSSPLTVAAASHPRARTVVHYDERGLAFFALGYTSATKKPAALICSSGTAAANFLPAVIETSKKKLPMILLTADRPPELRFTGALQTIDQVKLYGDYVRWHLDMPCPDPAIPPQMVLTTMDQAVFRAREPLGGPVHLNCMFREPLAPEPAGIDAVNYLTPVNRWLSRHDVYTRYSTGDGAGDFSTSGAGKEIIEILNRGNRGIMVVGKLGSPEEENAVLALAERLNWPVFPDIVSGLRFRKHPNLIHYFDQVLHSRAAAEAFPIDTVLHLGGRITSKRWYRYIKKQAPRDYIMVLSHALRSDPGHMVGLRVKARVKDFAREILPHLEPGTGGKHLAFFIEASRRIDGLLRERIDGGEEITEIGTARIIGRHIPGGGGLFLSNSMPVREMDMFAPPVDKRPVIGANRGASGIDGIIATACGFARGLEKPATLLTGDLAFLHDLNSLALVRQLTHPLVMVVVNNDGGGIFSFLPIAGSKGAAEVFEPYFAVPHGLGFEKAAGMFGPAYAAPRTPKQFEDVYKDALAAKTSTVIEVKTDRNKNHQLHRDLSEKISILLEKMIK